MNPGTILIGISLALILGLISNRLIKLVHLPNVTAYLIVGILIGPYFWSLFTDFKGILTEEMVQAFGIIVDVALGFIAFSIGVEFKFSNIKKLGKGIVVITLLQACSALVFVDVGLMVLSAAQGKFMENLPLVLTLGAIATATAPAATLMVIKQYKAQGPVTSTLLPVVAFDDAVGLILFSISFSLAQVLAKQQAGIDGATLSAMNIIVWPLVEILSSLAIGAVIGLALTFAMKWFKSRANRLICMIASVFLGVALCDILKTYCGLEMSSLLTCMMIGALFCNLREDAPLIFDGVDRWTPAIFMLFFILSGADLNFSMITWPVMLICLVYLIMRSLGKYLGAFAGCSLSRTDKLQPAKAPKYLPKLLIMR